MTKKLDPAQVDNDPNRERWTVKDAVAAAKRTAIEAKPGTTVWILSSPSRAKLAGKRIEEADPGAKGLYLVTQSGGSQSWALRGKSPVTGKTFKLTLGSVDTLRELGPGEEPQIGEPLSRDMALALAASYRLKIKQKADPRTIRQQAAEGVTGLQSEQWEGHLVDNLFVEFMKKYPLIRGKRKARDSSKRQTALFLGLKPDGRGSWTPTGNGVLSKWQGKIFSRRDGSPVLGKQEAYKILDAMEDRPIAANRTLTALKLFGSWAEDRGYVSVNPFITAKKQYEEHERNRILDAGEILALWQAVTTAKDGEAIGYPYGRIAQFILATGQRPGEVREAAWTEFDFAEREWTIPGERMKSGKPHIVPLSQFALELLATLPDRGPFLFSAEGSNRPVHKQSRVKARLDERVAEMLGRVMPHWTYHDLRHTAYSGITALGFTYIIADKVVDHAPPAMAKVYDQYDYYSEKWEALAGWADRLADITAKDNQSAPA